MSNFNFELYSFVLGFLTASLFWFLYSRSRNILPNIKTKVGDANKNLQEKFHSGVEIFLIKNTLQRAQNVHITKELFSFDEIIIEPRVIAPQTPLDPDETPPPQPLISQILPYTPDWPEISAQYPILTLSIEEVLVNGGKIALVGQPGMGKTCALADFVIKLCKGNIQEENIRDLLPVYLHMHDFHFQEDNGDHDPLNLLIETSFNKLTNITKPRFSRLITNKIKNNQIILVIDGLDEAHGSELEKINIFLKSFCNNFPETRVIIAASPDYLDGLIEIDFTPVSMAAWGSLETEQFIRIWHRNWDSSIVSELKKSEQSKTDYNLINNWLISSFRLLSPLEWTLVVWSAYSGDLAGTSPTHALNAYIERVIKGNVPRSAIVELARTYIDAQRSFLYYSEVDRLFSRFRPDRNIQEPIDLLTTEDEIPQEGTKKRKEKKISSSQKAINYLLQAGLLYEHGNQKISFTNPLLHGFLASFGYAKDEQINFTDLYWSINQNTLRYLAAQNIIADFINNLVDSSEGPLFKDLFITSRWLNGSPQRLPWRKYVLKKLGILVSNDTLTEGIHARITAAFLSSNDPSVSVFFNHLMSSPSPRLRQMAAIGAGSVKDSRNFQELKELLADPESIVRTAAGYAVGAFEKGKSEGLLGEMLMNGDEELRIAAAETISQNSIEASEILQKSIEMDNILLRRAAIAGLARIKEKWAALLLEKVRVEDGQWVIRNAADQALEMMKPGHLFSPKPITEPHESEWLIKFASKQGSGVSSTLPATEILISALRHGDNSEKIAALKYLRQTPNEGVYNYIFQIVYEENNKIREIALESLWHLSLATLEIPSPKKFGLG